MAALTVVTGNPNKAREIGAILGQEIASQKVSIPELQSLVLREVVEAKARAVWERLKTPILVEDVSLALDGMKGFPGTFVRFWEENVGYDLAAEIVQKLGNNRTVVSCGVGYFDGETMLYSEGSIIGTFVPRRGGGEGGFGFDYHFVPEGFEQTFSEMGAEVKNTMSHRQRGWTAMRALLVDHGVIEAA